MPVVISMLLALVAPTAANASTAGVQPREVTGTAAQSAVDSLVDAIAAGDVTIHTPRQALKESQAKVLEVPSSNDEPLTSVTFPVADEYSLVSNLTALIDDDGLVVQYSETLFSENAAGNFQVEQFLDGTLDRSEDIGLGYMTDAELIEATSLTDENTWVCPEFG